MKLTRFCSHHELQALLAEGKITNDTDHYKGGKGGSTSRGFCLSTDPPEEAWRYLKGIVTPGVCVRYDIPKERLTASLGKYRGKTERLPDGSERITPALKTEYCTPILRREWIAGIVLLESFIPPEEISAARYCHDHKEELLKRYRAV